MNAVWMKPGSLHPTVRAGSPHMLPRLKVSVPAGARAVCSGAAAPRADQGAPLYERVRLADVVAAGPCHRHLVVGLALREAREHGRLGVLERDRLRHRDQLRLHGSRCNETAY